MSMKRDSGQVFWDADPIDWLRPQDLIKETWTPTWQTEDDGVTL